MLRLIGNFGHQLIDPIAENGKRRQAGNRHQQPTDGGHQCLINALSQGLGLVLAGSIGHALKRQ